MPIKPHLLWFALILFFAFTACLYHSHAVGGSRVYEAIKIVSSNQSSCSGCSPPVASVFFIPSKTVVLNAEISILNSRFDFASRYDGCSYHYWRLPP